MKTKMQQTSLDAYAEVKTSPNEKAFFRSYLAVNNPLTDLEVSKYLGWPINCVTGRRNSLEKKGKIKWVGKKKQNGRSANLYFVKFQTNE